MGELVKHEQGSIADAKWHDSESLEILKDSLFRGATPNEFKAFLMTCAARKLDPIKKQVTAIKIWNKDLKKHDMVPMVTIDGLRAIAHRTGQYAGMDEPRFEFERSNPKIPLRCSVTVHKLVGGVKASFTGSAEWSEFYPGKGRGFMWDSKPKLMLSKVAKAQALREAFPEECGGLYASGELDAVKAHKVDDSNAELNEKLLGIKKDEPTQREPTRPTEENSLVVDIDPADDDADETPTRTAETTEDLNNYIIPQGRHKGKKLSEIDAAELDLFTSDVLVFVKQLTESGQTVPPDVEGLAKTLEKYGQRAE